MKDSYDITIVGGGIVGLATAWTLCRDTRARVLVLEAEDRVAAHQTGHNSGVIHSGLYYKPDSLKARNCVAGRDAMYRFCADHGIAHERCGKWVVATVPAELSALAELERRGRANGLQDIRRVSADELKEKEPNVTGVAALWVGETGIVDFTQVAEMLARLARQKGAAIQTRSRVTCIRSETSQLVIETERQVYRSRCLINCGGLQSDRIARLSGVDPGVQIIPFRGEYYKLVPERYGLVHTLIYPVPDPRFPFLGVHFTKLIHGGIEAGPNAVLSFRREGYHCLSFSAADTLEMLGYRGFWNMAYKYWKTGMGEVYRSFSKSAFVRALQVLAPSVTEADLMPGGAGVRAQAVDPNGALLDDFRIVEAQNMIHVLNAPSPAATASLSIGETIATLARKNFGVS